MVKLEHAQKRLKDYNRETLDWVYEFWRLKRKSNRNEQLLRDDDKEPEAGKTIIAVDFAYSTKTYSDFSVAGGWRV